MNVPQGAVTFVFTDIVGSTRLWEKHPEQMRAAVQRHDELMRAAFLAAGGHVFKTVGDAFCVAFAEPSAALTATAVVQRTLAVEPWGVVGALEVRIGTHTGTAEMRDGDYFGGTLNRAARIEAAAHGGQVLVSGVTRSLVLDSPPEGLAFRDLGEHRLKSLERAEHLFQLTGEGLTSDFPPPRSMNVLPNNLPAQTTSFIGRAGEVEAITARLSGPTKLVTLTGSGGTGKTRLALEAGASLIGSFRGGVWLVELAVVTEAPRLAGAVTAVLGIREEPGRPLVETLVDALRRQELLLILDNCEHLARPVAALTAELLKACDGLRILATSRSAMGIGGEVTLPVPPLGIFNSHRERLAGPDLVRHLAESDAVRLFVERARAVRPDFELNDANAASVGEICSRLDGIPLALELAAARLRLLDPRQIAERLADRFRLLRSAGTDRLPHQQTLQALVDWSHDLLTEPEKVLFRRLGIFVGGRSLEAIEAVCPGGPLDEADVLDVLQGLVEKSLVGVETGESGEQRYTLLESVWHYARRLLEESGEKPQQEENHARYFLVWAVAAQPHFEAHGQTEWLARFDDDLFNLDVALRRLTRRGEAEPAMQLLAAVGRPMEVRGYLTEGYALAQAILALPAEVPPGLRSSAEFAAARLAWALDRYEEARQHFLASEQLAVTAGERERAGLCRGFVGFLERGDGRVVEAEEIFRRCLVEGREWASPTLEAVALGGLGRVALAFGRLDEAREMSEAALALHHRLGDRWTAGLVLWGLARTAIAQGEVARAGTALREWADIAASLGNNWTMPYILQTLASAAVVGGDGARAARLLGAAEAQRERYGFRLSVAEQFDVDEDLAKIKAAWPAEVITAAWREGRESLPVDLWPPA
jgi:predicted ATPase/class 3 adenylate cyclase